MQTRIRKCGNGLVVQIPHTLAADARLEAGAKVDITVRNGELVIVPVFSLTELIGRITPENLPDQSDDAPRGAERW